MKWLLNMIMRPIKFSMVNTLLFIVICSSFFDLLVQLCTILFHSQKIYFITLFLLFIFNFITKSIYMAIIYPILYFFTIKKYYPYSRKVIILLSLALSIYFSFDFYFFSIYSDNLSYETEPLHLYIPIIINFFSLLVSNFILSFINK
ncbi:membrane protein [Neisseria meningitidis]|nr:membrane protein [Neisseria meningitidis]CWU00817.1 membrane protein [Neisseria meningitidis]